MDDRYQLKHFPPPNRSLPRQVDYDASRDPRLKRVDIQGPLVLVFHFGTSIFDLASYREELW